MFVWSDWVKDEEWCNTTSAEVFVDVGSQYRSDLESWHVTWTENTDWNKKHLSVKLNSYEESAVGTKALPVM